MTGSNGQHDRRGFYGRRKGPRLRLGQAALYDTLLPRLRLDLAKPAPDRQKLSTAFFGHGYKALWLEIGFGGGEHLIHQAAAHTDIAFIGCEPFVNGMAKALAAIDAADLKNIRLYDEEAGPLLHWLPEAALDRVYLLYPDPWPKRRHWKRRFISMANLNLLARVMKPGAELRFATDIETYADWALRHIRRHPAFQWTAERADDWRRPFADWPGTRYENKAIKAGRTPGYFIFRRINNTD